MPAGSTCNMQPERRNRVKVLLFLDVGGSMDPHVQVCEELFSAAKSEFRHLEYFYFHNCVYDYVWRDNARRRNERVSTLDLLRTYGPDWKVIFVGDAAMSPYELVQAGGSVEYRTTSRASCGCSACSSTFAASPGGIPSPSAGGTTRARRRSCCRSWAPGCSR